MPVSRGRGRAQLVKTQVHRDYQTLCLFWAQKNRQAIAQAKATIQGYKEQLESLKTPFALRVDCYFAFEASRVFNLKKAPKQLDANNRLKPLLDGLVKVLEIDDKHFFAGNCEKVTAPAKEQECTLIGIEMMRPRTLEDIKRMITTPGADVSFFN